MQSKGILSFSASDHFCSYKLEIFSRFNSRFPLSYIIIGAHHISYFTRHHEALKRTRWWTATETQTFYFHNYDILASFNDTTWKMICPIDIARSQLRYAQLFYIVQGGENFSDISINVTNRRSYVAMSCPQFSNLFEESHSFAKNTNWDV